MHFRYVFSFRQKSRGGGQPLPLPIWIRHCLYQKLGYLQTNHKYSMEKNIE